MWISQILFESYSIHIFIARKFSTRSTKSEPGSSVAIPTELRAGRSGIESLWGRDYSPVQTGPGPTQPPVKWVLGFSRA